MPKLNADLQRRVAQWSADWKRTSTITDPAALAAETAASVVPDFSGELVAAGQQAAMRGNIAEAMRLAKLATSIYPDADGPNGLLGVLLILTGDAENGAQAIRKSVSINRNGFFAPANVLRFAAFLANGPTRPAAVQLLTLAIELHPDDASLKKTLAELR